MLVDRAALERHRKAIHRDAEGWFVWGELERLWVACHVAPAAGRTDLNDLYRSITAVRTRVDDLRTTVAKLDWMRGLRDHGDLDPITWMYFAASDVVAFLTNVRSMFDQLAGAMRAVAHHRGGVPRSFHDLQKWLVRSSSSEDDRRRDALGSDLADIVDGARDWFLVLRAIRDELIHRDAQALVFPGGEFPGESIGVQVYERARLLMPIDALLMLNQNVVDFRRFAAAVMARVYVLLEDASEAIRRRANLDDLGAGQSRNPALGKLADWTDELLALLPN